MRKAEFETRRNTVYKALESERQMQLDVVKDIELIAENLGILRNQVDTKRIESEQIKDELNQVASRLYGLEDLQQNFEGFQDGVKNILMWQRTRATEAGVEGEKFRPLAEVVEVPEKYELAMEAALGQRLQVLLNADNEATDGESLEAIDYLKTNKAGRSSFATSASGMGAASRAATTSGAAGFSGDSSGGMSARGLSSGGYSAGLSSDMAISSETATYGDFGSSTGLQTVETTSLEPLRAEAGFDSFLDEVVAIAETHRAVVKRFFNNVVVVDTLANALVMFKKSEAWRASGQNVPTRTFVTLEGDTITADGVITGGASDNAESGVLRRRREIKELSLKREELAGKTQLAALTVKKAEEQLRGVEGQLEVAKKNSVEKEIQVASLRKDLERAEIEFNNAQAAFEREKSENDKLQMSVNTVSETLSNLQEELTDRRMLKAELDTKVESLTVELNTIRTGIDERQREVTDLRIRAASRKQEVEGLERQLLLVSTSLNDLESQLAQMSEESERNNETLSSSQIAVENLQSELTRSIHATKEAELAVSNEKNIFEQEHAELRRQEEEFNSKQSRIYSLRSTLNEAQLKAEQLRMREAYLVEQTTEKYQLSLREVANNYREIEGDLEATTREIEELKDKVKRIGEVNLAAIQEYDELITRYTFLTKQHEDLIEAKEHLRKVIDRINRICARRFKETFELVNDRFKKVFPVLFGGGEASLVLIESAENDDPGIDIISRPPGKKMQSVTLLSGGEKALTAVSLIFS
ncbi:MAG: hypothetical protein AABZ31_04005, partial [Bdellovibrionota bacterium]